MTHAVTTTRWLPASNLLGELVLAWRMLRRDARAGELKLLGLALVLAVASVSSVGFFSDRVRQALLREATQLLGADVLLLADHPWPDSLRRDIAQRGLQRAETVGLVSMARHAGQAQLASVKAVSDGYPLRGSLLVDGAPAKAPAPGTVWLDARLAQALAVQRGQMLELGERSLRVAGFIDLEPDRGVSFFNIAPRLMMHVDDLASTALVQPGSRINWQMLAAGAPDAVQAFERAITPALGRGESLQSLSNARPEMRAGLDRSEHMIGLTAMLAVILAAVAVSQASHRFTARHLDGYAVMRCFGVAQSRLLRLFGLEFALLGVLAAALGCALGWLVQWGLAGPLAEVLGLSLPTPSLWPLWQGLLSGLALLLGFSLPPLWQLARVPALRVIRRDLDAAGARRVLSGLFGVLVLALLLLWQAGDRRLAAVVLGGFAAAFALFGVLCWLLLQGLGLCLRRRVGDGPGWNYGWHYGWRLGLINLHRRAAANSLQILSLALALTALLMLSFTRGDLLESWRAKLGPDTPNRFLLNIQPEQREPVEMMFAEAGLPAPQTFPMVRGRLLQVNGQDVDPAAFEDRARRLVEREFNLSAMQTLPSHNRITAGRWFESPDDNSFSVEEGIARTLGWKLGDELRFQVAGRDFTARIGSLRKLDWDSMRVNFFVIAPPALLREAPASYITSFRLPEAQAGFANQLSQRFPNLTLVDTAAILRQAQAVADQLIAALQWVFLFALAAGVLVLLAGLLSTRDERRHEAALMRALGASRRVIATAQGSEFLLMGALAGLLAASAAAGIGLFVAERVFQFSYQVNLWIWPAGMLLGLLCALFNAWTAARAALSAPPALVLRQD